MQRRAFLASLALTPFPTPALPPRDRAPGTSRRIHRLIAEERAQFEYIGTMPGHFRSFFYYRDRRNPLPGYLTGHETEPAALCAIENTLAARVLNRLRVDHGPKCSGDLALWLKGLPAEELIAEILSRDAAALC